MDLTKIYALFRFKWASFTSHSIKMYPRFNISVLDTKLRSLIGQIPDLDGSLIQKIGANMKNNIFLILCFNLISVISVQAQAISISVPLGVMSYSVTSAQTTYMSLPLTNPPFYFGTVSAVTANSISIADTAPPWTANGLVAPSQPYFLKFLTGPQAGRFLLVTANTVNTIYMDITDNTTQSTLLVSSPASAFDVQVGNTFELIPGYTLAGLFGNNTPENPLLLVGSTSVFIADSISVYNSSASRFVAYYFNTTSGFWEASGSNADFDNAVIYPYSGFTITRRSSNPSMTLSFAGSVADSALLIKTLSLSTIYTSTQYATGSTLATLQFGPNWTKGTTATDSDNIGIWNPVAFRFVAYYQLSSDSTWRKSGDATTNQSSFAVPAGSFFYIQKNESVSGAASFLRPPLPYSLQ